MNNTLIILGTIILTKYNYNTKKLISQLNNEKQELQYMIKLNKNKIDDIEIEMNKMKKRIR